MSSAALEHLGRRERSVFFFLRFGVDNGLVLYLGAGVDNVSFQEAFKEPEGGFVQRGGGGRAERVHSVRHGDSTSG